MSLCFFLFFWGGKAFLGCLSFGGVLCLAKAVSFDVLVFVNLSVFTVWQICSKGFLYDANQE